MPNSIFRRWTADDIAKLKNLGSEAFTSGDRGEAWTLCRSNHFESP